VPASEFSRTSRELYSPPRNTEIIIPVSGHGGQHIAVMQNFADAILEGKPLIAPAAEGLLSLELANAMLLSTFEDRAVELPFDPAHYEKWLQTKIAESNAKQAGSMA
jgi:predicted dehydrogenase